MASTPLYYTSLEQLLLAVRIESANDLQTKAAVDQAVADVRLGFFQKLGRERALQIASLPLVEDPTTEDEILRSYGASAEALWLTSLLIERLPVLFMSNNSTQQLWNDEAVTRDAAALLDHLKSIKAQLDGLLNDMVEEGSDSAVSKVANFAAIGGEGSTVDTLFAGV